MSLNSANDALLVYKGHVEDISGFPAKEVRKFMDALLADQTQMAWKKKRDHHLVIIRSQYSEELVPHVRA